MSRAADASVALTERESDQLGTYYGLLTRWNRIINLTALRLDPPAPLALDRLLIEPLAAANHLGHPQGRWIDLGSGGGSPAIPLKIVRPQLRLTMVEARERKAAFLREAARQLAMDGVDVLNERFELLSARHPELGGRHLLVTVRAVRIDMALLQSCRWLLAPGGRLLLFGAQDAPGFEDAGFEASGRFDLSLGGSRLLVLTVGSDTA